jgi:hypothetical protein
MDSCRVANRVGAAENYVAAQESGSLRLARPDPRAKHKSRRNITADMLCTT